MTAEQGLVLALQASIMLTVLGLGLMSTWEEATFLFREPALLLKSVLSMSIVMPVVTAVLATAFDLPFEVKVALAAYSVSPVPPLIQKNQLTAGGRMDYVVGLLVAMSVLAIVVVPLTVTIFDRVFGREGVVTMAAIAKIMLMTVLGPLVVGLLIRHWFPGAAKASRAVMSTAFILLVVAAAIMIYGLWPTIRTFIANGVVLMLIVLALIALAVGHFLGGPLAGDRTTLAMATVSRHPAVALAIATSGPATATQLKPEMGIILLYLVVASIVAIPYQKWRAHSLSGSETVN